MSSKARQGTVHTAVVINFVLDEKLGSPAIASWQGGERAQIEWSQLRVEIPGNSRYPTVYANRSKTSIEARL